MQKLLSEIIFTAEINKATNYSKILCKQKDYFKLYVRIRMSKNLMERVKNGKYSERLP